MDKQEMRERIAHLEKQIDMLAAFLLSRYPDEIGNPQGEGGGESGQEGAVQLAIRLLENRDTVPPDSGKPEVRDVSLEELSEKLGKAVRNFFNPRSGDDEVLNYIAKMVTKINIHLQEIQFNQGAMMGQVDDLRSAIEENAGAAADAVSRVEAKLAELGEPDADLTADIQTIKDATAQIRSIADPATPDPGDPEFDPGPVVGEGTSDGDTAPTEGEPV